jgi:predicted TIM-barrel fold metal-dependent hydrolase
MVVNDAHCHFFSTKFFFALGQGLPGVEPGQAAHTALARLGWESPGTALQLADRWAAELDRHGIRRAALIASVPSDVDSVASAVARHPRRFVGFFMVDPTQPEAHVHAAAAIDGGGLRTICLFPAMHRYSLQDLAVRRLFEVAAARPGSAVFVHCGVLTVGARARLGLPSRFDIRYGNPLDLQAMALDHPSVPIVIPHFGAGFFRETLMVADICSNVVLDTSSSNAWMKYQGSNLSLTAVFTQALAVVGPERLLFGSDSSFFPRGWVREVFDRQRSALEEAGVASQATEKILGGNFDRLFPMLTPPAMPPAG